MLSVARFSTRFPSVPAGFCWIFTERTSRGVRTASSTSQQGSAPICFLCGQKGHISTACTAPISTDLVVPEGHRLPHRPVMLEEVINTALQPKDGEYALWETRTHSTSSGQVIVDATFGVGGHTRALLAAASTKVIACDRDFAAINLAQALAEKVCCSV